MFDWLGSSRYVNEITCLTNDSVIVVLYIVSDVMLGVALACASLKMWTKRKFGYMLFPHQVQLAWILGALLSFSYFVEILVIYEGAYRLEILFRGAAAGVASVFAFSFWIKRG